MPTRICPQCGKEFYNPSTKVICCSTKCSYAKRNTAETRICKQCGSSFQVRKNSHKQYCSVGCRGASVKSPEKNITKCCKLCGKEFQSWAYRNQIYCSLKCKNIVSARQPKPAKRAKRKIANLICEWCRKPYIVHQSQNTGERKSRFCSVECRGKSFSATHRGINHPNWRGGGKYPSRGRNWSAQRRKALERDNHSCQVCGLKLNKNNRRIIDVHHIKPYRQFNGDYIAANNLLNLITLCRSCHKRVEHAKIPCPTRLF